MTEFEIRVAIAGFPEVVELWKEADKLPGPGELEARKAVYRQAEVLWKAKYGTGAGNEIDAWTFWVEVNGVGES